ncbi:MAG: YggS family pyridoxal phosphate-dependent enzyme [Candidatus Marinimicrobia bacterium]|nr:YggS family pyridoxal phosphate-dependent enzyme [Candidatus Neomarinimicrobiota bacterium]
MKRSIEERLEIIRTDIREYSPYPERVRLVAVSKKQPVERIYEGVEAGIRDLGENRIQDALEKFAKHPFPGVSRHFVGYLQSNKANKCLQNFDWLHSLQTEKLARIIARKEPRIKCLIEVNISGEDNKTGIAPDALYLFMKRIREYRDLEIRGLMGMAAFTDNEKRIRDSFVLLRTLLQDGKALETENLRMEELSMGMTNDYKIALEEGSTMLRIGTAVFGPRIE